MGPRPKRQDFFEQWPEGEMECQPWQLYRVKGTERLKVVCLSAELIGRHTHYWGGRSVPCTRPAECVPCSRGNRATWHSWFAGVDLAGHNPRIIELTRPPIIVFREYFSEVGTLRCSAWEVHRSPQKDTGKMYARCIKNPLLAEHTMAAPSVALHLCRIWGIGDLAALRLAAGTADGRGDEEREAS